MTAVEWHPIPGWPKYEITKDGRVRSWVKHPRAHKEPTQPRELKGFLCGRADRPYRQFVLSDGQRLHKFYAHRLVALAFIGPPSGGSVVRHLDDDSLNNHVSNLAYGTQVDNGLDMVRNGGSPWAARDACSQDHPYTEESTYWTPAGRRRCRVCQRTHNRAYKARLAQAVSA